MALSWQMGKAQDKAEQRETVQEKAWTSSITHTLLGDTFLLFTLPLNPTCVGTCLSLEDHCSESINFRAENVAWELKMRVPDPTPS